MSNIRKTRVVCTIGPSSSTPEAIREMIKNGMNVARLNFSHGTHESHRNVINIVRSVAKELGVYVGILQDLCGPKIRLGNIPDEGVRLVPEETVALSGNILNYENNTLPVSYPNLEKDVKPGESILIADGMIELKVKEIKNDTIICQVLNGGLVFSRKGVNLPSSTLSVSAFSNKDRDDFKMGLEEKVDFVAMSFVRSASDLVEIRKMIAQSEHKPKLISKIEKPQAIVNLDEIIAYSDGVMVARGDLGVELPLEQVPILQKKIIKAARNEGKFVITATQMLMSMVANPRPTRGEVSDVANAVLDGTDAIMLSDESANGKYPIESCATLGRIAAAAEPYVKESNIDEKPSFVNDTMISRAVGHSACWLAKDIEAVAIVAITSSGLTANAVARFRPEAPIIALTSKVETCRALTLCWGTKSILIDGFFETDKMFEIASQAVIESGIGKKGDKIVVTAGVPIGVTGSTNLLKIIEL